MATRPAEGGVDAELIDYLAASTGLTDAVARRVLAYYAETVEAFAQRRHAELKSSRGMRNERIYRLIAAEIRARRFSAARVSERQVRRMIYG